MFVRFEASESQTEWKKIPLLFLCALLLLEVLGVYAILRGDELVGGGTLAVKQSIWVFLSIVLLVITSTFHYRKLKPVSLGLFILSLICMGFLFFFEPINGARSWLKLGPVHFQPSELMKISYILMLSQYLMYRENYGSILRLVIPFLLTLIPCVMVLLEPDLGTAMLFFPVLFAMLYIAGAKPAHLLLVIFCGILCLPMAWKVMNAEQKSRITALFQQRDGGLPPRGDGYHLYQSKFVLASGNLTGRIESPGMPATDNTNNLNLNQGNNKKYHLPASRTDFIICLIGERLGFLGIASCFVLYLLLFYCALQIAIQTREPFGRLVVSGVIVLLASQVIINTGMTVGLAPITGLTLPLLSYGGSSLMGTSLALGLIVNIAIRPGYEVHGEPFAGN